MVEILRKATHAFAERGFHGTGMRDLAEEVGLSPASLYHYVPSKEELLYRILDGAMRALLQEVRAQSDLAPSAEERFRRIVRVHLSFVAGRPQEVRLLTREYDSLTGSRRSEVRSLMLEYLGTVSLALEALRPSLGPRALRASAFALIGMLTWVHHWYRPWRDVPVEALAEGLAEIFLRGFLVARAFETPTRPPRVASDARRERAIPLPPSGAW